MSIFEKAEATRGPAGTGYWLALDGLREVRVLLPDDLTADEAERVIAVVREHLAKGDAPSP